MSKRGEVLGLALQALVVLVGIGGAGTGWAAGAAPGPAGGAGDKRIALVIGNGRYADAPLSQPTRNVEAMVPLLKTLGFDPVLMATDLNLAAFRRQVLQFIDAGRNARLRLFYYAGHGENYQNQTYLLPIGHDIQRGYQLQVQAFPLAELLAGFQALEKEGAIGVNLMMLDTCRVVRGESFSLVEDEALGLGRVTPVGGTLIAYATSAGEKAWGLAGDAHSLFTKHLLRRLRERDEIKLVLTNVRADVKRENPQQITETSDKLDQRLYLAGEPGVVEPPSATKGTLVIGSSQPPGVVIYVDGARLGPAPQELELPTGKVMVTAQQEGYEPYQESVWIRAGQRLASLNVVLKPIAPPPAPPIAVVTPPPPLSLPGAVRKPLEVFRDRLRDGSEGPALVVIPAGKFLMGSPKGEKGRGADERQHEVSVAVFALGQHEVTVGEFQRFVKASGHKTDAEQNAGGEEGCLVDYRKGSERSLGYQAGMSWKDPNFKQSENHPVVCVSWNDAVAYAEWLSKETGQSYRLPREVEWEYAARAKTTGARYWGEDSNSACQYANVADQAAKQTFSDLKIAIALHKCTDGSIYTAPAGSFAANRWGLKDILGNVWEWTCSTYDEKYGGLEDRCSENNMTSPIAIRGGCLNNAPANVRAAKRNSNPPRTRTFTLGFRIARLLETVEKRP